MRYDPESEVASQKLYDNFHDFTIPPNSNPIEALHKRKVTINQMAEKKIRISDTFLHAHFVPAISHEYGHVKATLQAIKNREWAEIVRMVDRRYSTQRQIKGLQRSSRPPEHTFFKRKSGGRSGARRGRGAQRGCGCGREGTQGRGHAGEPAKVEVAAAKEAAAAPVVLAVVATAAVADFLAAVGDAAGGATLGRSATQRRATSSPSVLGTRV